MLLWLITVPLLAPFIVLFSGEYMFEDQQKIVWGLWGLYNRLFLLIILYEICVRLSSPRIRYYKILVTFVPLSVFFLFQYVLLHSDFSAIFNPIIATFYTLTPMIALSLNKKAWPNIKGVYITVLIVLIIELLFIPLNMEGIFAYTGHYEEIINGMAEGKLMCGTFTRSNMMADYVSIVFFFITIDYFIRRSISFPHYILVSVIVLVLLVSAGSRLPIVLTVISVFLCIVLFRRKHIILLLSYVMLITITLAFLGSNQEDMISENEGLNRIVSGLSSFTQSDKKNHADESTVSISQELIERYYIQSPIIGLGRAYKDEDNAYPLMTGTDLPNIKSDATLAFYLTEYGIIGVILLLLFYYAIIDSSVSNNTPCKKKIVLLTFCFFFLFSITEGGIFFRNNFTFIYIYVFGLSRYYYKYKPQKGSGKLIHSKYIAVITKGGN